MEPIKELAKKKSRSDHAEEIIEKVRTGMVHCYLGELPEPYWEMAEFCKERTYMMVNKGTAFGISKDGLVATCCHCTKPGKDLQMISLRGELLQPTLLITCNDLDVSLLQIPPTKTHFNLAKAIPPKGSELMCVGNPDPFDRSNKIVKIRTDFLPFNVSVGQALGCVGKGVTREGKLGPFKHGCWTYWGHSGGPIVDRHGEVAAIHNSWDSTTGTRRAMTCLSIREAIRRYQKKTGQQLL